MKLTLLGALLLLILATAYFYRDRIISNNSADMAAVKLVQAYADKNRISRNIAFDNGDISFGEVGFNFRADKYILTARYLIMEADTDLIAPSLSFEQLKKRNWLLKGDFLNSSPITEYFQRAGGYFEFDKEKDMLFIKKAFALGEISQDQFLEEMETFEDVALRWRFRWFRWAAAIYNEQTSPPGPPLPVSVENDKDHSEFAR